MLDHPTDMGLTWPINQMRLQYPHLKIFMSRQRNPLGRRFVGFGLIVLLSQQHKRNIVDAMESPMNSQHLIYLPKMD